MAELAKRVELLEGEVDDLNRGGARSLKEENAFLQRLIEDAPRAHPPAATRLLTT